LVAAAGIAGIATTAGAEADEESLRGKPPPELDAARAENARSGAARAAEVPPPLLRAGELSSHWHTPATMRGGNNGHFSVLTSGVEASLLATSPQNRFHISLQCARTDFRFPNSENWFGDSTRYGLNLHYEYQFGKRTSALFSAGASLAAEDGAKWADALSGRIGAGLRHTWTFPQSERERLSVFAGFMIASRHSADPVWLPFCGLSYRISDHWSIQALNGAHLTYDVYGDRTFRLEFGGHYNGLNIRLKEDGEGASRRRRALQGREGVLTVSATKEFLKRAGYITASVGGVFLTKYKIVSSGHNLGEFKCDPAATFGLEFGLRF
jgi:hypothetical protein